jgi:hypothetical protein
VACGSRTSMLDPDAYSSTGAGGSSNVAGSGSRSGSPGKAGSPGDPNAVDPNKSTAACTAYCRGYRVQCSRELGNRDCLATCAAEINNDGKQCQQYGIKVLECMAPLFPTSGPSLGCEDVSNRAAAACGPELGKFQSCSSDPTPTPTPDPKPSDTCTVTEAIGPSDCFQLYECMAGTYFVECSHDGGTQTCNCYTPAGPGPVKVYSGIANPCLTASADCGFL